MDHLSSMDASFLHLETPETPMHVGSLMLFDLPEGYRGDYYDDVKAQLAKRLHLARLFRRKLAPMPFELADPVWIDDDDIDLDYHVRSVTLRRPGTMEQLEVLIARLHSSLLDRSARCGRCTSSTGWPTARSPTTPRLITAASTGRRGSRSPRCSTT